MTTATRIKEIVTRPDFDRLTLQEIGDEVGVTRERVRQILEEIGLRPRGLYDPALPKTALRVNDWLRQKPDDVLIAALKEVGNCAALARLWGVSSAAIRSQLKRRGLTLAGILAPVTVEELEARLDTIIDHKRARASQRMRWFRETHPEKYREWSQRHNLKANTARREANKTLPGHCPTCGYKIRQRKYD